jgi:predicted extracellular nuclease
MARKLATWAGMIVLLLSLSIGSTIGTATASAATGDPVLINEVLASHTGTDDTEYIEFYGTPGTSLDGLSLIVVEGDNIASQGAIDRRLDFGPSDVLGSNGFYLVGNPAGLATNYGVTPNVAIPDNYLENSSLTVALVETASITGGSVTGSEVVRDAVALNDGDAGDTFYLGAPVIGPDGPNFPAGVRRLVDGVDTDTAADWAIADFSLGSANTPMGGDVPPPPPPPVVTIMEIQGSGQFSPYDGQTVETSGVVTLFTANGAHCWIQDPDGDGDSATSDGIFVSGCGNPDEGPVPSLGDAIWIVASVEEQQYGNALPLTRLTNPRSMEVFSTGNVLPAPVPLLDLPNTSIPEAIAFWEPLEGMLVSVTDAPVAGPTSAYGEFVVLAELDAEPGSGYYPQSKQILIDSLDMNEVDYNPERIMIDDSSLDIPIVVMPGDRVRSLVGVVDYTFGNYKLQPVSYDVQTHKLPNLPASTRSGPGGDTTITTFNVENLFDLEQKVPQVVDVIGELGFDPGSQWGTGEISTQDNTIRRKATICQGDMNGSNPFDPSVEWEGFPNNTFDGLGAHTADCAPATNLFISEYIEGSSYNKAIEIYNGTGTQVNLKTENYALEIYFNGSSSPGQTVFLEGTIAPGDVFVLANPSADPAILAQADQTSGGVSFNGDDAVVLRKGAGKDDAGSTPTPEQLETKLSKLAMAIQIELELPEILIVEEVENTTILQELGNRVNAAAGTNYQAVSFETSDARGIEVGFLWDTDRVELVDAYQMSGPAVEAAFGSSSESPGREPLVGVFAIEGREVTIVGNHFKSKGGDDALFGVTWPPARSTEVQRKAQAQVVRDFVNGILDADPGALVVVAGDLNDFQFGEPGEGADHPLAILEGGPGEVPLTDLIMLEKAAERYTYVYDGNSQVLDHMLVSPALQDLLVATDILHFDASYPAALASDPTTPLNVSDHDPVEGRFVLGQAPFAHGK